MIRTSLSQRARAATPILAIAFLAGSQNLSFGQGKGPGGGGHVETTGNNLSYPASFTGTAPVLRGLPGQFTLGGAFGQAWSYGCALEETVGTTTYANTSCVTADASGALVYLPKEQCAQCAGATIERIYWQKTTASTWQAGSEQNTGSKAVSYVNWGDNLETGQWSDRSVIRVETTPFFDLGAPSVVFRGFQMWHVAGQGPSEMWGLRATDADTPSAYVYDSQYTIIHTTNARLNLTRLGPVGGAGCPATPPSVIPLWSNGAWTGEGLCTVADLVYTPELNIGGKWVFGYNWQLRNQPLSGCLSDKSGWWRLTFYAPDVNFNTTTPIVTTEPPGQPTYAVAPTSAIPPLAETALYKATVDKANNLTYIDICINSGRGGGR